MWAMIMGRTELVAVLRPPPPNDGVGPFGLIVGWSILADLQEQIGERVSLNRVGEENTVNKWTRGPMYEAENPDLGIAGLQKAFFTFDPRERLVYVELTLPKGRFGDRYNEVKSMLSERYPLVSDQAPHVGDQLATFRKGDVTIEASAPHLGSKMTVRYKHKDFVEAMERGREAEREEERKRERSQF